MSFAIKIIPLILLRILEATLSWVFWLIVIVIGYQYKRLARIREAQFGLKGDSVIKQTLYAVIHGILGGFLGSYLMILMGVSLNNIGIQYLWPLAIFLMLWSPRFLCFSYAGGIIALISFLFPNLLDISIPQLMALVAILHMVESGLILISGHLGATPMFTRNAEGRLVGGFTLQKFWPIPLVALFVMSAMGGGAGMSTPSWWPLIKPEGVVDMRNVTFVLVPVTAALGYGDLALARTPKEKSKLSARNLGVFSIVLLLLAFLSSKIHFFGLVAALFSPLGHELVIYLGQKSELRGKPIYVNAEKGLKVLEVVPGSPAWNAGLSSGDVILFLNGFEINSRYDLEIVLWNYPAHLEVEYLSRKTGAIQRNTVSFGFGRNFGIIAVPTGEENFYAEMKTKGPLAALWGKYFGRKG